jgi:hypothetical protein
MKGREIKKTRHRMLNEEGKSTHYPSRGFLQKWIGKRINFVGRISGFGIPKIRWELPQIYFSDQYILLRNIISPEFRIQIDHVWVPYTEEMKGMDLSEGQNIEFQAEVIEYSKKGGFDFTLTNVSNIRIMKRLVFALN